MREQIYLILGFDPGGKTKRKFGWSVCSATRVTLNIIRTGRATDACAAFDAVNTTIDEQFGERPACARPSVVAAGIDAPLRWGMRGDREVDQVIRDALPNRADTNRVMAVNSLQGAVTIQGVLLGKYLYRTYGLNITETHPFALLQILQGTDDGNALENLVAGLPSEHERDATISAFAAWKMQFGANSWRDLYEGQNDLVVPPFGVPASYRMPI